MGFESAPEPNRKPRAERTTFSDRDFIFAKKILEEHAPEEEDVGETQAHEWRFYTQRGESKDEQREAVGDIAEAAVFSLLNHEDSPLYSENALDVSVELATRAEDIKEGFDGVLKVSHEGKEVVRIRYDATANPMHVLRKIEEVLDPKRAENTKVVLGFDIGSAESPWQSIKEHKFSSPYFRMLLQEMEVQLKGYETYAERLGDAEKAKRHHREWVFVRHMLKNTSKALPAHFKEDSIYKAIEKAVAILSESDPQDFRKGRPLAA